MIKSKVSLVVVITCIIIANNQLDCRNHGRSNVRWWWQPQVLYWTNPDL